MTETKFVLLSRTVLTQLFALAMLCASLLPRGVAALLTQDNLNLVLALVAQLAAIYFRIIAKQTLTVLPVTDPAA